MWRLPLQGRLLPLSSIHFLPHQYTNLDKHPRTGAPSSRLSLESAIPPPPPPPPPLSISSPPFMADTRSEALQNPIGKWAEGGKTPQWSLAEKKGGREAAEGRGWHRWKRWRGWQDFYTPLTDKLLCFFFSINFRAVKDGVVTICTYAGGWVGGKGGGV